MTTRALDRCRTIGARYHAIDVLDANVALAAAKEADDRLRAGRTRGPLDGVPVFAKAIYDMNGLPTTGSSAEWPGSSRNRFDATRSRWCDCARRAPSILGKTAADDFAYRGNGTSSHTGQVLNPHDKSGTKTPGGSSAGSAVAVATGMAFAALGTDDGGSNRIPAQFAGVVGMKPTFGLVPRTGVIPTWPYLDTHGPLARSVSDAALLLAAIVGADSSDPLALATRFDVATLATLRDDALAGVKLGLADAHVPRDQMTTEALSAWERAVVDLRAAGAIVEAFTPPVTRLTYRDAFNAAARARGDVAVDPDSPPPTANALYRYFSGRTDDPRAAIRRGYAAYQKFYNVLPPTYEECEPLFERPMAEEPAGRSFARSRAEIVAALESSMRSGGNRGDGLPDDALQRAARRGFSGRTFARRSASETGSAYPKSPFPPASEQTEYPRSTSRWSAYREGTPRCCRWRTLTRSNQDGSSLRHSGGNQPLFHREERIDERPMKTPIGWWLRTMGVHRPGSRTRTGPSQSVYASSGIRYSLIFR